MRNVYYNSTDIEYFCERMINRMEYLKQLAKRQNVIESFLIEDAMKTCSFAGFLLVKLFKNISGKGYTVYICDADDWKLEKQFKNIDDAKEVCEKLKDWHKFTIYHELSLAKEGFK